MSGPQCNKKLFVGLPTILSLLQNQCRKMKTNKQHHGTGLCCSRVLRFPGNIFFSLDDKEVEVFALNTWNLRFPRFRTVRHSTITLRTVKASSGPVAVTLEVSTILHQKLPSVSVI